MPRTKTKIRTGGRRGRPGKLASLSIEKLQAEITRRQQAVPAMMRQRDELARTCAAIEIELKALGATIGAVPRRGRPAAGRGARRGPGRLPGTGRRRPKNAMNLVDALAQVLKGKTLSITDAVGAVQKAGYKSVSKTFSTIVNQALLANKKLFRKVARGRYTAR